jgi:hypothetical protein
MLHISSKKSFILIAALFTLTVHAAQAQIFLKNIRRHETLASTIPDNGDQNPYALIVAPVSAGRIQKGDVLVDNFNKESNLQGTGTTIVDYNPSSKKTTLIAELPQHLAQCPGGVGLSTAMTMLKSGYIIVGSTPSSDGTTRTKGPGGLLVLDSNGRLVATWANAKINDPWGNMATVDNGSTAILFVSMAGFDVPGPDVRDAKTGGPVIVRKATVLRINLSTPAGSPPVITGETVIADGFGQRADRDAFLIGPTGLALGPNGALYVSDALANQIVMIPDAMTRGGSAGTGRTVASGGLLHRPLALTAAPNGHLLSINATNGQVVEVDPASGKQLGAQWIDADQAQSPPGNGDLFGIAMTPDQQGFYYVEDDVNTLMKATP